jgi:hypothetical protein
MASTLYPYLLLALACYLLSVCAMRPCDLNVIPYLLDSVLPCYMHGVILCIQIYDAYK